MDLIINYPEGGLNRFMPNAVVSSNWNQIDSFFGSQDWRSVFYQFRDKSGLHRQLIDFYKSNLIRLGYQEVIRADEIGGNEPLVRNTKEAPLYRLLFASKNPLGKKFWQEITSSLSERRPS